MQNETARAIAQVYRAVPPASTDVPRALLHERTFGDERVQVDARRRLVTKPSYEHEHEHPDEPRVRG